MIISLSINTSENERVYKKLQPVAEYEGNLKEKTSLLNPTIIIQENVSLIRNVNYMYIPDFNRKYFITNITSVNKNLVEIEGRIDVLCTYADSIVENDCIIHKQENKWNLYLNDGSFKVYQNPNVITKPFNYSFNDMCFILAVASQ